MDILLIVLGALNLVLLVALLVLLITRRENSGLVEKIVEAKGEVIERVGEKNQAFFKEIAGELDALKTGNRDSLDKINATLNDKLGVFQKDVFEKFDSISTSVRRSLDESRKEIDENLAKIDKTLVGKIDNLQKSNEAKLEQMRGVVEEKLDKTLHDRLNSSFELVSKNLESVQKGLGEMQSLATNVGDLKMAMTNVKVRGVFGEVQLERILEDMLTTAQFEKNVQVKPQTQERVEFAIKMPGKNDDAGVYLPIDSKFPLEDYNSLLSAYESGDKANIDAVKKSFANRIGSFAKDISTKYINPPQTTDFAILFLPFESLYAEIVQTPGLFEELQKKYKVTVTGPTTLSAFLNALQMGFQTLSIEKRSSEVRKILGAVKTEFEKFEDVLGSVQKRIQLADKDLDKLVRTRTKAINKQLGNIDALPETVASVLLPPDSEEIDPASDDEDMT